MEFECDIILEKNVGSVVFCGETISGSLAIRNPSLLAAKGIYIQLRGKNRGSCKLIGGGEYKRHEEYNSSWEYIYTKSHGHPAGQTEIKFELPVPENFPPTFAFGGVSYIDYKLAAYATDENLQSKKIGQLFVTVHGKLDLRSYPPYKHPVVVKGTKTFVFSPSVIEFEINLPHSGFAIGQRIPFTVDVRNESSSDCYDSKMVLMQFFDYIHPNGLEATDTHSKEVEEKTLGPILKHSNKKFNDYINIPPSVCISTQHRSNIVIVYYKLRFIALVKGPHLNEHVDCPITIGSIPLDEYREEYSYGWCFQ